jgi:hypothetical protein
MMSYIQWEPLFEDEVTLPEILSENGVNIAAMVDTHFHIRRGMNYDRGFRNRREISSRRIRIKPGSYISCRLVICGRPISRNTY